MNIFYEKVKEVKDPQFSNGNAGIDFFIPEKITATVFKPNFWTFEYINLEKPIELNPGDSIKIESGIKLDIMDGYALDLINKSGVALNGLTIGAELIDSSYTGEINFHLIAHRHFVIEPGLKIVQGVIIKDYIPESFILEGKVDKVTNRGDGGFGSTGTK